MLDIILVDDEETTLVGLSKLIARMNKSYRIVGMFEHPLQALPFLQKERVDAVITDIQMPFVDGIEFIRMMREQGIETPVILLSGYDYFSYARSAIKYKVTDFLLKPVDEQELSDLLFELLEYKQVALEADRRGEERCEGSQVVQSIRALIKTEFASDLDVKGIAARVHLNANYLSRLFKNETGESLSDCLIRTRMEHAEYLLRERADMKIYEIAAAAGYSDSVQFTKMFKKTTGKTPKEYRHPV